MWFFENFFSTLALICNIFIQCNCSNKLCCLIWCWYKDKSKLEKKTCQKICMGGYSGGPTEPHRGLTPPISPLPLQSMCLFHDSQWWRVDEFTSLVYWRHKFWLLKLELSIIKLSCKNCPNAPNLTLLFYTNTVMMCKGKTGRAPLPCHSGNTSSD